MELATERICVRVPPLLRHGHGICSDREKDGRAVVQGCVLVALVAGFALGWSNMVHVADSGHPENLAYYSVLAVGIVGALLARLRAQGLALTLFAMAGTLAVIALLLPSGAPPDMARRMAIGHAVFVALFLASGLLFRRASLRPR